jgi:hypothetical protein
MRFKACCIPSNRVVCHDKESIFSFRDIMEEILLPSIGQLAVASWISQRDWKNDDNSCLLFGGILDKIVCMADIWLRHSSLNRYVTASHTLWEVPVSRLMFGKNGLVPGYQRMNLVVSLNSDTFLWWQNIPMTFQSSQTSCSPSRYDGVSMALLMSNHLIHHQNPWWCL